MIGLILAPALSENQFHPVVGDTRFQAGLDGHCAEFCGKFALIGGDNFRTAISDDGLRHALLSAPRQLRTNRCMPDKTFSALANAGKMNRFRVSCDRFARVKVKCMDAPGGPRPGTLARAPRVQISKKEPAAREHAIPFTNEGIFYAKGKFSISSAMGGRTRCGERAADHAVGLRWRIFDYGTGTCTHAARDDHNLRPRRREGRADRCHSVYHTERVEGCFALSTFR